MERQDCCYSALVALLASLLAISSLTGVVSGETWVQTTEAEFSAGTVNNIDVSGGSLKLHPSLTEIWTERGEAINNYFGWAVSSAGDVNGDGLSDVIAGAIGNSGDTGKAYVYFGSQSGLDLFPSWTAVGEASGDYFGWSVGTAGDVNSDGYSDIIVGAYGNDEGGNMAGKAYLYLGSASGPSASPDWTVLGNWSGDYMGFSAGSAGDVNGDGYDDLYLGASNNDSAAVDGGRAYVFHGSGSGLGTSPNWIASGEAFQDYFGEIGGTAGDVNGDGYDDLIVGSWSHDDSGTNKGKAYVYHGSASGLNPTPNWTDVGENDNDWFADAVSTAGDVNGDGYVDIVIGATNGGPSNEGKSYVYLGSASGLSASPDWTALGETPSDDFGEAVSSGGDVNGDGYADVLIGASSAGTAAFEEGTVYLFVGSSSGLGSNALWSEKGEANTDRFGKWVASAGDVDGDGYDELLVGSDGNDDGGGEAGKAYSYSFGRARIPESTISLRPTWVREGEPDLGITWGLNFGTSVASTGDVNGDGYDDIIIGDDGYYADPASYIGKIYIYHGSANGPSSSPDFTWTGSGADDDYGTSVASAGDVNGDGYDDVIIGADEVDISGSPGFAEAFYGSSSGISGGADWTTIGEWNFDNYGTSVSSAGDVNGDGYDDVLVSAPSNGSSQNGKAYLYYGSSTGLSTSADWTFLGDNLEYLGNVVSSAGDVNADGYSDIVVGASDSDMNGVDSGAAYVFLGGPSGPDAIPNWKYFGETANDNFGSWAASAGDVNGDGFGDVIIAALNYDNGIADIGKSYLFLGSYTGLESNPSWTATGEESSDRFGSSVACAGDLNLDGFDDVIIGSRDGGNGNKGKVYVYAGSATGLSTEPSWTALGNMTSGAFGESASPAGDVNGDGSPDLIVGDSQNDRGRADIFENTIPVSEYLPYGEYLSDILYGGGDQTIDVISLDWAPAIRCLACTVRVQVGTSNDKTTWSYSGPDATGSTFYIQPYTVPPGIGGKYVRLKVLMSTTDVSETPVIDSLSLDYQLRTITKPSVIIRSPNGGEDWMRYGNYSITWQAVGTLNDTAVSIHWSPDNGDTWLTIATGEANDGIYNWTVPNQETSDAIVRVVVTDIYGSTASDTSDSSFAIDPPPVFAGGQQGDGRQDGGGGQTANDAPSPGKSTGTDPFPVQLSLLNLIIIELLVIALLAVNIRKMKE